MSINMPAIIIVFQLFIIDFLILDNLFFALQTVTT